MTPSTMTQLWTANPKKEYQSNYPTSCAEVATNLPQNSGDDVFHAQRSKPTMEPPLGYREFDSRLENFPAPLP